MADDLDHLDDLPKRDANHVAEEKAETAFQACLTASGRFILQRADRKDYGTETVRSKSSIRGRRPTSESTCS